MTEETENQTVQNEQAEKEASENEQGSEEGQKAEQATSNGASEEGNVVYIGKKPFMNYVVKIKKKFSKEEHKEVVVKAKGKLINRAIDAVEILRKRFLKNMNLEIKDVKIDSEFEKNNKDKEALVSNVEITVEAK